MLSLFDRLFQKKQLPSRNLQDYIATFFDVSTWEETSTLQTGGTREKCWVRNPQNFTLYFFKKSIEQGLKVYPTEFWMEIIASKVGQSLGLKILDYNIAKKGDSIGCISKHMVNDDRHILTELMSFLVGYDSSYNVNLHKHRYTVDFIYNTLQFYGLERFMPNFIEVVIFDCIIGNQDRHQENWGLITPSGAKTNNDKLPDDKRKESWKDTEVAPIYDSGSSLGREKSEENVKQILQDKIQFISYIDRYKPEIRFAEGGKIKYSELLNLLLSSDKYGEIAKHKLSTLVDNYDAYLVCNIINNIDKNIPNDCEQHKLSQNRKDFVFKLIDARILKLKDLL